MFAVHLKFQPMNKFRYGLNCFKNRLRSLSNVTLNSWLRPFTSRIQGKCKDIHYTVCITLVVSFKYTVKSFATITNYEHM